MVNELPLDIVFSLVKYRCKFVNEVFLVLQRQEEDQNFLVDIFRSLPEIIESSLKNVALPPSDGLMTRCKKRRYPWALLVLRFSLKLV